MRKNQLLRSWADALETRRFNRRADMEQTLLRYVARYNHPLASPTFAVSAGQQDADAGHEVLRTRRRSRWSFAMLAGRADPLTSDCAQLAAGQNDHFAWISQRAPASRRAIFCAPVSGSRRPIRR